jgi:hypothetical protein
LQKKNHIDKKISKQEICVGKCMCWKQL